MPCQYCRNPSHSISLCESSVERWIGPINEMWLSRRYDILSQIETLSGYSRVKLLMVGRSLGMSLATSSNKGGIITRVIKNHILTQVIPRIGTLSMEEQALMNNSYDMLLASNFQGVLLLQRTLRMVLTDALEEYYIAWVGRKRMGMSMAQLMYLIEHPGQFLPEDPLPLPPREPANIIVNQAMQEAVECGVCYDTKSRVKFNCSHEFCKDCVHLLCVHKGANPIKCPMCRARVSRFEVEDEESMQALLIVA